MIWVVRRLVAKSAHPLSDLNHGLESEATLPQNIALDFLLRRPLGEPILETLARAAAAETGIGKSDMTFA